MGSWFTMGDGPGGRWGESPHQRMPSGRLLPYSGGQPARAGLLLNYVMAAVYGAVCMGGRGRRVRETASYPIQWAAKT